MEKEENIVCITLSYFFWAKPMKRILYQVILIGMLASCKNGVRHDKGILHQTDTEDALAMAFEEYSNGFLERLWQNEPAWASEVGYHKYDSILKIPNEASKASDLAFVDAELLALREFDVAKLSVSDQCDFRIIQNYLELKRWRLKTLKEGTWNPSQYNVAGVFALMLSENYAPLNERLQNIYKRLLQVPAYYSAAEQRVKEPVAELRDLAIEQNEGGLTVFRKDLVESVKKSDLPSIEKYQIIAAAETAARAVEKYVSFLKTIKNTATSFRLGKDLYEDKFKYEIQSSLTAAELYNEALSRKKYLHGEMAKLSKKLWPKYFQTKPLPSNMLDLIEQMIDAISAQHVEPAGFQAAIEKQIPELVKFVKEKNLLYVDPKKPLVIRKEPAYMAGVAGVSISAPGPYDKNGNTYYNVGSLEGWPKDKAESYLKEYNNYVLQLLNIHEAIPGHYTQLVYANRSPSIIKAVLGNDAMIEGWAVYAEHMMLENGYGNNEPEIWLMWYKWHLRTVCNTILDYSVHAKQMSKQEALHLLTKEAFQEQAEAEGKWKRVTRTSVQLTSYYSGYYGIYNLRESIKKKEDKFFDLRAFHEQFLSFGSAPVKYISELMLK